MLHKREEERPRWRRVQKRAPASIVVRTYSLTLPWGEERSDPHLHHHEGLPSLSPVLVPAEQALRGLRGAAERSGWSVPTPLTQSTARTALARLYRAVTGAGLAWKNPHVSGSPSGVVALEWWSHPRDLTLFVEGKSAAVVRSWGTSVADEMADDTLNLDDTRAMVALWRWLDVR